MPEDRIKLPLNCDVEYREKFLSKEESRQIYQERTNTYGIENLRKEIIIKGKTDRLDYVKDLLPGTITDILPNKTFHLLDTVYLIGKNFMRNSMVSVYAKGTKGHARYRRVPESHILNRTDTLITMVIPNSAVRKKGIDLSDEWFPISGKIKITKGYAQFNVMTWSEK